VPCSQGFVYAKEILVVDALAYSTVSTTPLLPCHHGFSTFGASSKQALHLFSQKRSSKNYGKKNDRALLEI
jgi:hypothetical protein